MSSMFGGGFKATKCKTLLRLAMARIKLLRNKRDIQVKQMRKDIAQLLSNGQEPSARIRVEHIAREQNILAAYDIIELFCELIIVRLPILESQKVCPMDLKEAVSSLIFASPRCADLPELLQIRGLFTSKYGKEFVAAAAELRPECGVNRRVIEKLSVRAPSGETKLKLLKEIATEHNVDWDPTDSEAELMKQPEDLLDGHKKFFGASESPISLQPSPPKMQQSAPAPAPAPAPVAPRPGPITMEPLLSSESEEDTPTDEKKQFIPFVGPVPTKGAPAGRGSQPSTKGSSSSVSSTRGAPQTQTQKEGSADYENHADYQNVAAAAKAAAESADRAVAAARAAAELAKTHPSQREPISRTASKDEEESSSEEESEEEDDSVGKNRTSGMKNESTPLGKKVSFSKANDSEQYQEKPDRFYRSNSDDRPEDSFRRSNSDDYEDGGFSKNTQEVESNSFSFSKTNYPEERSEKDANPVQRFDSEQDSYWRSGDQDWRKSASFAPGKNYDSAGFFPSRSDEQESLFQRNSDIFKGSQFDDPYSSRPKDKESNTSTSKLFSSSDSGRDLFKRTYSEEKDLRSSDETPFYDTKQGFATPKFDDEEEEVPYTKPSRKLTTDSSYNRDFDHQKSSFDSPKSKPSAEEVWPSSFSIAAEGPGSPKTYTDDYQADRRQSDSYQFDTQVSDSQGLARGGSDPTATKSYDRGDDVESPQHENQTSLSPISKSRRTRKPGKGLEGAGGSVGSGGLPPSGRLSKYSSADNFESARSPDYHSYGEPDNSTHSFDDSPNFPPKTSLHFYNTTPSSSTPPDRTPPSVSSAYESPETFRESSPSVNAGSQSNKSSPGLSRRDSPSAPAIHPKLPDYDDLTARFEALKGKARR